MCAPFHSGAPPFTHHSHLRPHLMSCLHVGYDQRSHHPVYAQRSSSQLEASECQKSSITALSIRLSATAEIFSPCHQAVDTYTILQRYFSPCHQAVDTILQRYFSPCHQAADTFLIQQRFFHPVTKQWIRTRSCREIFHPVFKQRIHSHLSSPARLFIHFSPCSFSSGSPLSLSLCFGDSLNTLQLDPCLLLFPDRRTRQIWIQQMWIRYGMHSHNKELGWDSRILRYLPPRMRLNVSLPGLQN
nr:uncharacterized protein LOC129449050 [Misgurnus anguillicaudatus]